MKKTTKRIITGIMAVLTIALSAVLFAGCGEKSDKEKFMDAISDAANDVKSKINAMSSSEESEKERETVTLNLLDKIITDKLYTVKFNNDLLRRGFYIRLNDTVDIDGYTVELRDKPDESYNDSYDQTWDIKKGGEKLASFEMKTDTEVTTEINNNKIAVSINVNENPTSDDDSEVDFKFTEISREDIEIDVPAELTEAECKQHVEELKAAAWDEYTDYLNSSDYKNPMLNGVYYFPVGAGDDGDSDKARVVFAYSVTRYDSDLVACGVTKRPFILDGKVYFLESIIPVDIDLSQGTKIG